MFSNMPTQTAVDKDYNKTDDDNNNKDDEETSFYVKVGKHKKFKYYFRLDKMNNDIKRAVACNYIYRYGINEIHLNELEKETGTDYCVYKKICELIDNCRIVTATDKCFIIEIGIEGYNLLVEDICKKLLSKLVGARRVEKKNWTQLFDWKSICYVSNIQIMEWERVGKLEYGLNLAYIFKNSEYYYCTCNFRDVAIKMEKKIIVLFADSK